MSIYVKTTRGAANLNPSRLRFMKLNYTYDTLERADVSKIIYSKLIVIQNIPTGESHHGTNIPTVTENREVWIDTANSFIREVNSRSDSYPIPYLNPKNWESSVSCRLTKGGQDLVVITGNDNWTGYELVVTIKYIEERAFV